MASVGKGKEETEGGAKPSGVLQRIFSMFSGMGDPDAEKKKFLRIIAKELPRSRYKFYKPKGQEALPGLPRFFHEIYRITAPAQVLLGGSAS